MQLSEKAIEQMISPQDMISFEIESIIIKSFNKFIKDEWNSVNEKSVIDGREVASHIAIQLKTSMQDVIDKGYLQFAAVYTRKGWNVNVPLNDTPVFVFSVKR